MADFKTTLKRALGLGMLMEVAFIGGGYYFYQKYKKDEEFRNMILQDYPQLHESFQQISAFYLAVLPEEWKNRILDDKPGASTDGKQ